MRGIKGILLAGTAVVALVGISGTSQAQLLSPVSAGNWVGYFIGGHVGGGQSWFKGYPHSGETSDGTAKTNPDGLVGGVHAGYNWEYNTFVLGIEGDLSATGFSDSSVYSNNSSRSIHHDLNMLASLRGRLGLPMDRTLLYVTGGLAWAQGKYFGVSPDGTAYSGNHSAVGGVIGAGVEWMQNQNVVWRFEGLYYCLNDSQEFGSEDPGNKSKFNDAFVLRGGVSFLYSDILVKDSVRYLKTLPSGIGLYSYRYRDGQEEYVGVMAHEVEQIAPEAVTRDDRGIRLVDYGQLGLRLETLRNWARRNPGVAVTA